MATTGIKPDTLCNLVISDGRASGRGATFEAYMGWDWALVSRQANHPGVGLYFREVAGGYLIESHQCSWPGYGYWQAADDGIMLNTEQEASVFHASPTTHGFTLRTDTGSLAYDTSLWIAPHRRITVPGPINWTYWKFVTAT